MSSFLGAFPSALPVFAMLHLKGNTAPERFAIARREIDILFAGGVDAVIVENYYGTVDDVATVCDYLRTQLPGLTFGVNVLGDDWKAFEIANQFDATFVQLDSVAGHLPPDEDASYAIRLAEERERSSAFILGGVRFKYQPYLSGRSLDEDLRLGAARADAIVVTGDGTGIETPIEKSAEFRRIVGEGYPLVVGAGVTPGNIAQQSTIADAVVVGSYLKDTYRDTGDVDAEHVSQFMRAVRDVREKAQERETA